MSYRINELPQAPLMQRYLTLKAVWLLIIPCGVLTVLNLHSVRPEDFWWHLRIGQMIVQNHAIPTVDSFSFTRAGEPWVNQSWLMQILLYLAYHAGKLPLVVAVHAVIVTAGYTLLFRGAARNYGLRMGVLATLCGIALGLPFWQVRPRGITFLCFGLLIYLIEAHRNGRTRQLWWVLPLFAFWVNSHGGFVFGLGALGFYIIGQLWDGWRSGTLRSDNRYIELVVIGLLTLTVLSLNPQGPVGIANYVLGFLRSKTTMDFNLEFWPLSLRHQDGIAFFAVTYVFIVTAVRSSTRLTTDQVLNLTVFAVLTLLVRRVAPWYGFLLVPALASLLRGWWPGARPLTPGKPVLNGIVLAILAGFILISVPWWRDSIPRLATIHPLLSPSTPVKATAFLCTHVPAGSRGFQDQQFASYQVYGCPQLPLFADTRFELYPTSQWQDYLHIAGARYDWQKILARYRISYLFLRRDAESATIDAAAASPDWHEIYRDKQAVIFRKTASNADMIKPDVPSRAATSNRS